MASYPMIVIAALALPAALVDSCLRESSDIALALPRSPVVGCRPVLCRLTCPYGFETDGEGCDRCVCREYPRHCDGRPLCLMYCDFGFVTAQDGCPVCECRTAGAGPFNPVIGASDCQQKAQLAESSGLIGSYTPQCDPDGTYAAQQCHGSTGYCWCVAEDGTRLTASSRPGGPLRSCACPRHKHREEARLVVGNYVPQCQTNGQYAPVQCHAGTGFCWCADLGGNRLTESQRGRPAC